MVFAMSYNARHSIKVHLMKNNENNTLRYKDGESCARLRER